MLRDVTQNRVKIHQYINFDKRPKDIKISIIVPVYNVENYLKECLDSLVQQTLKEIEIICVNDGSKDDSLKILLDYAKEDDRVRVIDKENAGYGHAMNIGLDNAVGEYIGIVEPDDYIKLNMCKRLYKIAKKKDLDFIKADFYRFRGEGKNKELIYNHLTDNRNYYNRVLNPQQNKALFNLIMNTWSGIYKKSFLDHYTIRHHESPGASYQDTGFWFQTFCYATRVYFLDEPFYMNRRDNPNSSVFNKEKIYFPCSEYDYIYNILIQDKDLYERIKYVYSFHRYKGYMAAYNRSADIYRKEFLQKFANDFRVAEEKGELNRDYFTESSWNNLIMIMEDPSEYYVHVKRIENRKKNNEKEKCQSINLMKRSLRCLKQKGFKHCMIRVRDELRK